MSNVTSLTVAIPALNEEENIEAAILSVVAAGKKVPNLSIEIVVVDDGSTDRTAEIAREVASRYQNVRLLQNGSNLGLGASIRRGIAEAKTEKFLFIPGDNDIPTSTLELMLGSAHVADLVMIYFLNDEQRGRKRYLLSTLFGLIYTTCFDLFIVYMNGPAVYPVARLRELDLHSTRFSIVAEINVKLLRQGATFVELPSNRQVGLEGSTSASVRNLFETGRVFIQLLADVYLRDRAKYARRPVRVDHERALAPLNLVR